MIYNGETTLMRGRVEIDVAMRIGGQCLVGTVVTVKQECRAVKIQENIDLSTIAFGHRTSKTGLSPSDMIAPDCPP